MSSDPRTHFAIYLAATGEIVRSGMCRASMVPAQAIYPGEAAVAVGQMVADTADWVNGGLVEQRPGLADVPGAKALGVDEDWVIPGVPEGSDVWVDGALAGVTDATGLTLSFPLAATWQVRVVPPFPWKPSDCEVIVS